MAVFFYLFYFLMFDNVKAWCKVAFLTRSNHMREPELINATVIPAQAGYKMVFVDAYSDDDIPTEMPETWLSDVIGWRIVTYKREGGDIYSFTEAVTLDGTYESSYAILCPDGTVDDVHHCRHINMRAFLNHARETQEAAIARGLIKKAPDVG